MKTIYDLNLHEGISVTSSGPYAQTYWLCMRVASGWIYTQWDSWKQEYKESIFVPFDNRFYEVQK